MTIVVVASVAASSLTSTTTGAAFSDQTSNAANTFTAAANFGGTDLVMVTRTGGFGDGDDSAKKSFFESLGWTVTAIDDSAPSAAFISAASANDVMYVSDSLSDPSHESKVRDASIGVVNEAYGPMGVYFFGSSNDGFTSETAVRIVDDSHYITSPFATGTLTIYTTSTDVNYWRSDVTALPSGVQVLADRTTNANHETLYVAEVGAALFSANTAPDRRVFIPSDAAGYSNWNTDYKTIVERSLDWAAGNDTP